MVKVQFYIKADKSRNNLCPIYGKIIVGVTSVTFSTYKSISRERWEKTNRLLGNLRIDAEKSLKNFLYDIPRQVDDAYTELIKISKPNEVTAKQLKDTVFGKINPQKEITIMEIINFHNEQFKSRVAKGENAEGSLEKYIRMGSVIKGYLIHRYNVTDMEFNMINADFVWGLDYYLRNEKKHTNKTSLGLANNTTVKYIRNISVMVNYSLKREVLSNDKRIAAREIAEHCFVLLKNNNQVLPLKKSGTIALIGPLANDKNNMLGTWAVSGDPQLSVPVLDGIKNVAGSNTTILYAKGANITDDSVLAKNINVFGLRADIDKRSPDEMIDEALKIAQQSDVIVAVVGEASEMSGECASRTDITIPPSQKKLIRALAKTGKPLVLVIMSGRPLVLTEENDLATAILQTWHAGTEAGDAIADVLFDNYDPSGKLTMSFPRSVGQIPIYYDHKNTGRPLIGNTFEKFRSDYIDEQNSPQYPFGYGLSYTKFSYSNITLNKKSMTPSDKIEATVTVTNTGNYDGEETVELYLQDLVASITRPVKELKGFQKVFLKKGESKEVKFIIGIDDLKFYNSDLKYAAEPGDFNLFIGGSSDNVQTAKFVLTM